MFTTTPTLCLERGGVPHIEADMANDILFNVLMSKQQNKKSTPSSLSFYYAQSYFDAISLCTPCKVSQRDALTEMGLRSYTDSPSFQTKMKKRNNTKDVSSSSFSINFNHILLPRSPLYPVAGGLPTAEAGPSQDLIQGRVMMTTSKWNEVVSTTKPDIVSPLCELIAIQEASQLPARKKQSLTMRNEKWMKETIENMSSSSCDHHQVQFLFPLGTHFINEKANNNNNRSNSNVDSNNNGSNEDAAVPSSTTNDQQKPEQEEKFDSLGNQLSTGVTINEALYEQWCRKCAVMNSSSEASNNKNNFRLLGLLTLSSGETKEQLQQYLTDLFNSLVPLEQKMLQKTQEQSEQDGGNDDLRGKTLPPLKLVVGNVSDLSLLEEVSKVFFSTTATANGGLMNFDTEIICLSSIVPVHLAANGLALQRTNATSTSSSSLMLKGSSPSSTTVRRERDAADGDQENTTSTTTRQDPHQQKLHHGQEATSQFSSSSSVAKFHVINLWDPTFKFSTLPLSCAFASENKEELMKMNREFCGSASSCDCYTCQRHTAGYFHHLLDVHEMNAEILISVHNYTQWFKYLMIAN